MEKSVATIIRESLPEGVWEKGLSKVYQDTYYSKTRATKRWAAKYFSRSGIPEEQCKKVKNRIQEAIGSEYEVSVFTDTVIVHKSWTIEIVEK